MFNGKMYYVKMKHYLKHENKKNKVFSYSEPLGYM